MSDSNRRNLKRILVKIASLLIAMLLAFLLWWLFVRRSVFWMTISPSYFFGGGIIAGIFFWILSILFVKLFKNRFQYSLRTLMICFTLFALGLGLLVNPVKQAYHNAERTRAAWVAGIAVSKLNGGVHYAQRDKSRPLYEDIDCVYLTGSPCTNSDLEMLVGYSNLRIMHLENTQISDEGLEYFKNLKNLELVFLAGTNVTEKGINTLQSALPNCKIDMKQP